MIDSRDSHYTLEWPHYAAYRDERPSGRIPAEITRENEYARLLAETEHFFVIPALGGAFLPGYIMILPKDNIGSMKEVPPEQREELGWLIAQMTKLVENTYNRNSIQFEHGMCGCVSDHAHYHIIPVSKQATEGDIFTAVNDTLQSRLIGIKSVIISTPYSTLEGEIPDEPVKLTHPHDIRDYLAGGIFSNLHAQVEGKQLTLNDLQQDGTSSLLHELEYIGGDACEIPSDDISSAESYVYFKAPGMSFHTTVPLQSQFGREVAFRASAPHISALQDMTIAAEEAGPIPAWDWHEYPRFENIRQTLIDLAPGLAKLENSEEARTLWLSCQY